MEINGKCNTNTVSELKLELFQMTEITAEEVKCSCINAIRERESAIHFYWFRSKAD
jgi:hypothetical protein